MNYIITSEIDIEHARHTTSIYKMQNCFVTALIQLTVDSNILHLFLLIKTLARCPGDNLCFDSNVGITSSHGNIIQEYRAVIILSIIPSLISSYFYMLYIDNTVFDISILSN